MAVLFPCARSDYLLRCCFSEMNWRKRNVDCCLSPLLARSNHIIAKDSFVGEVSCGRAATNGTLLLLSVASEKSKLLFPMMTVNDAAKTCCAWTLLFSTQTARSYVVLSKVSFAVLVRGINAREGGRNSRWKSKIVSR